MMNIKRNFSGNAVFLSMVICIFLTLSTAQAQNVEKKKGNYDYNDAFGPLFYTKSGNPYRSASGKPGEAYWQNRADYHLSARLDEKNNQVSGTAIITYTNNSPDELEFLWMNLEQNLFQDSSRGSAIIPTTGSRDGARGQKFDGGYKIRSVKLMSGNTEKDLKYFIDDTRMQIYLPEAVKARGGKEKLKVEYSFISPNYGSDRMGVLETRNGKIFTMAQWYPRMAVYDDLHGWNATPYLGPSEFYLEYGDIDLEITSTSNHIVLASGELLKADEV